MTYQQVLTHLRSGQFERAIALLDQLLQTQAHQAELWQAKAVALIGLHRYSLAVSAAEQALQFEPTLASAHRSLGRAFSALGQPYRAIAAYKQAARHYLDQQNKSCAQGCLTDIEQLQHQFQKLAPAIPLADLPTSPSEPSNVQAPDLLSQAETQVQQGQYRAALETLNWLLQLAPNHAQALSQRAVVHVHCQAPQLAAKDMAQALALAPNDLTMRLQRGEMRQLMGDCAGAISDCTAVIQQQPNKPQAYLLRAQAHAQLGQAEAAFKDVSNALALAPDNVAAYQLRGQVCATAADLEDALANYRKAASLALEQGNWLTHQTLQRQLQALNERLQAQKAETARTIRIPIKHLSGGTPVVVVTLNGLPFDMVLDTGAGITQVTLQMSQLLNITALRSGYFRMADGRTVQQSMGRVQSAKLGQAQVNNLEVSISPTASEGLLGQNFLWRYDVKILRTEIELYLR